MDNSSTSAPHSLAVLLILVLLHFCALSLLDLAILHDSSLSFAVLSSCMTSVRHALVLQTTSFEDVLAGICIWVSRYTSSIFR